MIAMVILWPVLAVVGFLVGHSVTSGSGRGAAGVFGAFVGSFVWVACCWTVGGVVRHRRGSTENLP
ncbi:MAG: hypothetical protein ACTHMS_20155 [Jatrophihabitans sp.]|uniref:hypothetical protein n=1 Tax=Jatrophihabitans sp. TaxID=1932789 RepID=UPI003F823246